MSIFRQPWVIIFIALLGAYTYKVFSNTNSIHLGATTAQASSVLGSGATSKDSGLRSVSQQMGFPAKSIKGLSIKAFESMNVSVVKAVVSQVELYLTGEGESYIKDGSRFEHWLDTKVSKKGVLEVVPAFRGAGISAKVDFWSNNNSLQLKILVPQSFTSLETVIMKSVSGDLLLSGLDVTSIDFSVVSGDITLAEGAADSLKVTSVSGDVDGETFSVGIADIKSVSGDVALRSGSSSPKIAIKTVSGDLDLELSQPAVVNFKSLSGELTNAIKEGTLSGQVAFSSLSGDAKISEFK